MAATEDNRGRAAVRVIERLGRGVVHTVEEFGHCGVLVAESLFWIVAGPRLKQPVRIASLFAQMMEIGVKAIPIVAMMAGTIGVMLAIQGIHTLRLFGAESQVVVGIALAVTREFAPLITGIIVRRAVGLRHRRPPWHHADQPGSGRPSRHGHQSGALSGGAGPRRHAGHGADPDDSCGLRRPVGRRLLCGPRPGHQPGRIRGSNHRGAQRGRCHATAWAKA